MPIVRVEVWEHQSKDFKKKLAKELTKVIMDNVHCPDKAVTVIFDEVPRENWAIGGELSSDCFPNVK